MARTHRVDRHHRTWAISAVVMAALFLLALTAVHATASQTDTLAFLQTFPNQFTALQSSWVGWDYCSGWLGVTCDDATAGTGVHVMLSGQGLSGGMPGINGASYIDVVEIDLSNNADLIDEFKSEWAALKKLEKLDLSSTGLYGSIPDAWNGMIALQTVKITNTYACNGLPRFAGSLVSLTTIDLSNNRIGGALPESWAAIPNLVSATITGNLQFCGCIPVNWRSPVLIATATAALPSPCTEGVPCTTYTCTVYPSTTTPHTTLSPLTTTTTTTDIPQTAAMTDTLKFLQGFAYEFSVLQSTWTGINYCSGWTGVTCDNVADRTGVRIKLSNAGLVGQMPHVDSEWENVAVVEIDLSHNVGLDDYFDSDWKRLTQLQILDLSYTSLNGYIPNNWDRLSNLQVLTISNTYACRSLPQWDANMASLHTVDFSNNKFQGFLKNDWVYMPQLQSFNITGNNFCGCIPDAWRSSAVLTAAANAANPELTGDTCQSTVCPNEAVCTRGAFESTTTPSSTSPPVSVVQADTLAFLQEFADEFKMLRATWYGTNYCNGWQGVTCDDTTQMTGVHVNLSGAGLVGKMPELDDYLTNVDIVEIDLSNNPGIDDEFEEDWANLKQLQKLDLSNTSLYGDIPDSWNGMVALQSVKITNTLACRSLPNWGSDLASLTTIDLSNNKMNGRLASAWIGLRALATINVAGNNFCGCMPASWETSQLLTATATSLFSGATCGAACTSSNFVCSATPSTPGEDTTTTTQVPSSVVRSDTLQFLVETRIKLSGLSSWTGTDYCSGWKGVTCDDASAGTGVHVKLSGQGLSGYLPEARSSLTSIAVVEIDLSSNTGITGNFKSSWANLKQLQKLDLSSTALYGDLPNSWNGMSALQSIKITNTYACRSLPEWGSDLASLTTIDLSNNQLNGRLVSSWANIPYLTSVNLNGNSFCGCAPSEWQYVSVLSTAASSAFSGATCGSACTSANFVCGYTPSTTTTTTSTPSTVIQSHTLQFLLRFPSQFSVLRSTWAGSNYCSGWQGVTCDDATTRTGVHVKLSGAGLVGKMPEVNSDWTSIAVVEIDLSNNPGLTDEFEDDWKRLTLLRSLDLSYTSLRGEIPEDYRQLSNLQTIKITNTYACRSLPEWGSQMSSLRSIDLSNNKFQGHLEEQWANMPSLTSVNIAGNNFCGCMPSSWNSKPVLVSAANNANSALTSATCNNRNCPNEDVCLRDASSTQVAFLGSGLLSLIVFALMLL